MIELADMTKVDGPIQVVRTSPGLEVYEGSVESSRTRRALALLLTTKYLHKEAYEDVPSIIAFRCG